ncbi:MAG: hypothetical protein F6K19_47265 [Cyanothece sp. SIO1E1]|nr:hypothetical protein [Cyanothece sp. SIO1E1]
MKIFIPLLCLLLPWRALGTTDGIDAPVHPRGLLTGTELNDLRANLEQPILAKMLNLLQKNVARRETETMEKGQGGSHYDRSYLTVDQAGLYLLTQNKSWAQKAFQNTLLLLRDSIYTNPFSRGLNRATILQQIAITYDFCYAAWNDEQRDMVNEGLLAGMYSVNANMGFEANYNIESNWMGVRFGAVIMAASVWDEPELNEGRRSRALPLLWDAGKRLREHIEKNIYTNGWNGESLGYHNYGWSFVGPAIIALQNGVKGNPAFDLANFVPHTLNSLRAQTIATVAIPSSAGMMTKIDLSDDNLNANLSKLLALGWRLYPPDQRGELLWMYDYFNPKERFSDSRNSLLFSLLFYPQDVWEKQAPTALQYHDPDQGITIFRNTFQDENDIVAAYSATGKRIKGHQGPDTNAPRLLGLGVPWIIGGGRTAEVAGQSNLFPAKDNTPRKGDRGLGTLLNYGFDQDGGGFALGRGSCLGVEDHVRFFQVSFIEETEAKATIIIADSSTNGQRFRICTPEFNQLSIKRDGYLLEAPNGSTMRVTVIDASEPLVIKEEMIRYDGSTVRLNPGITYRANSYTHSRAIDIHCDQSIKLVITLQAEGEQHPKVSWSEKENRVKVGAAEFQLLPTSTSTKD